MNIFDQWSFTGQLRYHFFSLRKAIIAIYYYKKNWMTFYPYELSEKAFNIDRMRGATPEVMVLTGVALGSFFTAGSIWTTG